MARRPVIWLLLQRCRARKSPPLGFTLIEVLVVVAIIALLIAILLPSLKMARDQAQAAVCGSNMGQAVKGAILHLTETNMRKERWSTNYGWATYSMRANGGQSDLFVCPADANPRPTAAVLARVWAGSIDRGITSGDAIFNHVYNAGGGVWQTDVQDSVVGDEFGGDAFSFTDIDLLIGYNVSTAKQRFAAGYVAEKESADNFDVMSYKGEPLWKMAGGGSGNRTIPIMWMSHSANASSGLRNVRGIPALIVEGGKPGIFPQRLWKKTTPVSGTPESLPAALRFRHGGKNKDPLMSGKDFTKRGSSPPLDMKYEPATKMNVGFLDGHVQRMTDDQLMDKSKAGYPARGPVWYPGQRSDEGFFD
ncbi:MAG: prepilin-type N-terminal cleavage/methylation domain-containing protein [Phycisphaerae bacterium]|nr:prepilin-type N-terminal cleavage/methylation domain-containing protein [Phycisphaerae bacterium]